jgi:hypothetical protein
MRSALVALHFTSSVPLYVDAEPPAVALLLCEATFYDECSIATDFYSTYLLFGSWLPTEF